MAKSKKNTKDEEPTKEELYEEAQDLDVEGRSDMNKDELAEAVEEAQQEQDSTDEQQNEQATDVSEEQQEAVTNEQAQQQPAQAIDTGASAPTNDETTDERVQQESGPNGRGVGFHRG